MTIHDWMHYLIEAILFIGLVWAHLDLDSLRRWKERQIEATTKLRGSINWIGLHMSDPPPDKMTREIPVVRLQSERRPPSIVRVPPPTHREPERKERIQGWGSMPEPTVVLEGPMHYPVRSDRRHQSGEGA